MMNMGSFFMDETEFAGESRDIVIAHPAATVIPLRETADSFEVLLIYRNPKLSFQGGMWAFPGGRIEDEDYADGNNDMIAAARRAAVRESKEEAGIHIPLEGLVMMSRWTTPEVQPKRYQTWFFVATMQDQPVQVDGGETLDYRWMRPEQALETQRSGEIAMMPPTFVTLDRLSRCATVEQVFSFLEKEPLEDFLPRIETVPSGFCSLYHGDAAYAGGDINQPGRRHRFWGLDTGWRYERRD